VAGKTPHTLTVKDVPVNGSITIRFGGDRKPPNFVHVSAVWNCTIRLQQPHPALLDGAWKFPAPQLVN
jgi:hypothetical protein